MRNLSKTLLGLLMGVSVFASQACCEEHNMQMSQQARDVIANPKGTLQSRGVISLQDYIVEEQEMYEWLFKNHPIFTKYGGKTVGKLDVHAHSRGYGGSGIGLSIVKAIIEAHGGSYGVRNRDNGVEFWFELGTLDLTKQ